jgi:hypothetical protein
MRAAGRLAIAGIAVTIGLAGMAGPAMAKGSAVGGVGSQYFLNDSFTGTANTVFSYGDSGDEVYVGDWNGDHVDTLMIRRGNTFYVRNSNSNGVADGVFSYGDPGDTVLVGDWNGDGVDTLAVRRGNTFFVKNSVTTGVADSVFSYGDPGDIVLVGDWDGNHTDTLAVRRGNQYFVKNSITTGVADTVFTYGDPGDNVLVGHWSAGQAGDSLGVRRGNVYYLRYSLTSGVADTVFGYGNPNDTALVGDWNGDGTDTLGVRRPPAPPVRYGDGTHRVGIDLPAGVYRSSGGASCYWERLSGFGGSYGEIIANGLEDSPQIVDVQSSDAGFYSDGCGYWQPVSQTYPAAPQSSFGDGTYVVGSHINPGTYRSPGGSSCYWERLSGFGGTYNDIIANGLPTGPAIVTISGSDAGFETVGCGTWTP